MADTPQLGTIDHTQPPRLSVIIITHNDADLLASTIQSIKAQTFSDFELIIIDDASQDNTWQQIDNFSLQAHLRAHRNETTQGTAQSINRAFEWARGEFIVIHRAGATSPPERFAAQIKALDGSDDATAHILPAVWIDGQERTLHTIDAADSLSKARSTDYFPLGATMIRRSAFSTLDGLRPALRWAADYDFWLRLLEKSEVMAGGEPLYKIRFTSAMPEVRQAAAYDELTSLVRSQSKEELESAANAITTRMDAQNYFSRHATIAKNYLHWAKRVTEWGSPASTLARPLWWHALQAWPFSRAVWSTAFDW